MTSKETSNVRRLIIPRSYESIRPREAIRTRIHLHCSLCHKRFYATKSSEPICEVCRREYEFYKMPLAG